MGWAQIDVARNVIYFLCLNAFMQVMTLSPLDRYQGIHMSRMFAGVLVCVSACLRVCVSACLRVCVSACLRVCVYLLIYLEMQMTRAD